MSLVEIRDYRLAFDTFDGTLHVLDGIDLSLEAGQTLGIVGETGCGKSVLAKSVLGILPSPPARVRSGRILFEERDLLALRESEWAEIRGAKIAMIFQDPMTFLNPVFSVGRQLMDVIAAQEPEKPKAALRADAARLFDLVRLPEPEAQLDRYPHQLSGGMRQRVLIAMALSGSPRLLIADEPTTALDVTIPAQELALIREPVDRLGLAVMMISHDLGAVAAVCRRIAVMYAGTIVEDAPAEELLTRPMHPYTKGLLAALPELEGEQGTLQSIPGSIPNLLEPPPGCRFHPRCPLATDRCRIEKPLLRVIEPGHRAACHYAG